MRLDGASCHLWRISDVRTGSPTVISYSCVRSLQRQCSAAYFAVEVNMYTRVRAQQQRTESFVRDPAIDPVAGDVVETAAGVRRSVELSIHGRVWSVHYRESGPGIPVMDSRVIFDCGISEWREWAANAEILHASHVPFKPNSGSQPEHWRA
jgi:hypothetical protein